MRRIEDLARSLIELETTGGGGSGAVGETLVSVARLSVAGGWGVGSGVGGHRRAMEALPATTEEPASCHLIGGMFKGEIRVVMIGAGGA